MMPVRLAVDLCGALLAATIGFAATPGAPDDDSPAGRFDPDPLRKFLPRDDLYMQVPGGVLAVEDTAAPEDTVEQVSRNRNGGLIVGYCLRSSCSRVTHLVVLQVCGNRTGGPAGAEHLILGIVRLPYGDTLGYLKALQGRDYAVNFSLYGPFVLSLVDPGAEDASSLYALSAKGMGPVAPLEFVGLSVKDNQSRETIALQLDMVRDRISGVHFPHFEVRHLCRLQIS